MEAKCAEASRDRVRAAQLDAAIKADRRREAQVKRLDRDRINRRAKDTIIMRTHQGLYGKKHCRHPTFVFETETRNTPGIHENKWSTPHTSFLRPR